MIFTAKKTRAELADARAENERLEAEKERLLAERDAEIERLRQRIRLLEKALFGPRSERLIDTDEQLRFEDMLKELEDLAKELEKGEENRPEPKTEPGDAGRRKRRSKADIIPETLPREDVVIELPEDKRTCPKTGLPMEPIGEEVVEKLAYRPACYFVKAFHYVKYASPEAPLSGVLQAPAPDFAILGGRYDESLLAGIVFDKCGMHLPLYRQAERMRGLGIDLSRQTLSHLYIRAAEVLLPLYELMKSSILEGDVVFTDDTPVRLQVRGKGKTVTGRMWIYVKGGIGPPYRVFEFTVDRSKKRPKKFLKGFTGYIHADAYKGYDDLFEQEGVYECACLMHVRRKFVEATDGPPELREEILRLIRTIYRYERVLKDKPDETIVAVRMDRTAKLIGTILERTRQAMVAGEFLPASAFGKAVAYLHNLGNALCTFLFDARLKPDNGESERAIRPLAIGRKNWLFAGSERGGEATGVLLSLIQTCRAMDIEPFEYLEDVLRRIQGHPSSRLAELLPGNWTKAESYYG